MIYLPETVNHPVLTGLKALHGLVRLPSVDPVVKEHGRLAALSAHSSPTKPQPLNVTVAAANVTSSTASTQPQQHLGMTL